MIVHFGPAVGHTAYPAASRERPRDRPTALRLSCAVKEDWVYEDNVFLYIMSAYFADRNARW